MQLNKMIISTFVLVSAAFSIARAAEEPSLEQQLQSLDLANQAPKVSVQEKFYSVQDRYLPLKFKSEVSVSAARNFTGSSFLSTNQMGLGYRFHFSNRLSAGLMYSMVSNKFTDSAIMLQTESGYVPDVGYSTSKMELTAAYNLFYGKFRVSTDTVYYFDQYWALGPARIDTQSGIEWGAVADAGLVLWLGKWGSARLGVKDYAYTEKTFTSSKLAHNLHGHFDFGYLF